MIGKFLTIRPALLPYLEHSKWDPGFFNKPGEVFAWRKEENFIDFLHLYTIFLLPAEARMLQW